MLALCGIWRALHDTQHRWRWLAAASLAYGLAVGARPSLLLGAVILLVPVIQAWREKGRVWPLLAAACGPIMAVGLGLAIYNAQRFDNPLEFGQRYQVPLAEHQQFNWRYLWFNIRVGFLEPAQWSGDFPFVDNIAAPKQPAGYWQVVDAFGVLTNIPLVWLALALPLGWRSRPEEERARFRLLLGAVAALFAMCALPLLFHDSMCLRYELEYASPLVLLAVVGVFGLERAPAARPVWRRAVRCGWGLLLAFTVAFNVFAHFKLEADDWQFYGYGLFQLGRLDEAIVQFQKSLRINPDYPLAHNNLGNALLRKGIVDEGTAHLLKALQFDPDYADANTSLGNVLLQEGKLDEAVAHYEKALKKEPNSAVAHNSLANALMEEDKFDEAIAHFQRALEIQPGAAPAHYGLATAFMRTRRLDEAIIEYQKGMQADPNYAPAYFALGVALEARGRFGEAIAAYQKALQLNPSDLAAWNNLAWLLATAPDASLRDGGKALELARQADLQTGSNNMVILHTLAAAYAETGKFPEAVEAAQHALRLAQAQSNSVMTEALQNELEFYQTERPFHRAQAEH
jgi:tetratricopeptide (TPR) repeat protein